MYLTFSRAFYFRTTVLGILLFCAVGKGYGQRVYADAQQNTYTAVLASVSNKENPIDNDTTNFSTLNVTLGLVGLISAEQNLQFTSNLKPKLKSPLIVKFSTPGSLLDLLGGFSLQRTNNNTLVTPQYEGTNLLELLNLFGGGKIATLIIPPNGQEFDGARLTIKTTLGVARTAFYHFAFFITPPQENTIAFCQDSPPPPLLIPNYQTGYNYKVYDSETGGIILMETTTNTIPLASDLPIGTHTYWVEALENNMYPSARTEFTVTVHPKPTIPNVQINTNSQY